MWDILHMRVLSLIAVVAPHTGKIVKHSVRVYERGENLLQSGVLHFVIRLTTALVNRQK